MSVTNEQPAGGAPLTVPGRDGDTETRVSEGVGALRERAQQLGAILEQLPVGVGVLDTHGRFVLSNSIMRGYMPETLPSRDPQHRPHWHAWDAAGRPVPPGQWPGARALRGESVRPGIEFTFHDATGRERWLLESAVPFHDADGEIVGAIVAVQDITERKQVENGLRESERRQRELAHSLEEERARLAAILQYLPVGVWIADQHGRVIGKNQQADRIWAGNAPMSTSIDEYEEYAAWYAESGERLSPAEYPMARALQTGAPVEPVELKIRRFDGTDGIVLISATPTRDTQGLVTGAVVINVDITDRKRAETALREAEQKYRELVQFAPTGIYEINFQTNRLTSVNEAMIETLGYSREELLAMNPLDLLDAEDRAPFQARITRWLNGEAPDDNVEYRVKRRDGSTLHAVLNVTFIRDEQGNPLGATVIAHDITERKRAEEALRGSEARLRAALDASGGAIYDHRVPLDESTYHDERWAKMLGYRPDELPPYHHFLDWLWEQVHPDDLGPLQRAYDDFVEGRNTSYHVEIRLRHKQGHWVWVQGHSHAVERDDSGRVRRIVGVMSDITPFKQVQNALRRLNTTLEQRVEERTQQVNALARRLTMAEQEERRRLSQVLHDDLQQLLYAVEMQMTVLGARLERAEDPGLAQDLEGVRALVKQAISRTRQLTVDLSPPILQDEGLADALGWLQGQMQELHGLYVDLEAAHSFQLADADLRVLLFQIVRELLFNVVKHAGVDRATVRLVEDGQTGTDLAIHVIDQGCGFDVQEVLDREQPAGGFGLYSARERLRLLGGRLEIHSRPGGGTHVEVHAPMQ